MTRLIVGPFNRVEGDLEVKLSIEDGAVREAHVVSPLYRGFESILGGKPPSDALVYAPRICGICSVSQSVAAAQALAEAEGSAPPPNGRLAVHLIHAAENVVDHLTHFYLFFMPDFAHPAYAREPWYEAAAARFAAVNGNATREMLPARAQFLHLMGILAGKWPHTLGIRPGGSTRSVSANETVRLMGLLTGFRRFLQQTLFGASLEEIAALGSMRELAAWATSTTHISSDFRHFLHLSGALGLNRLGRATDRFMSYGAYPSSSGVEAPLFPSGVWTPNGTEEFDPAAITEDLSHAWYEPVNAPQSPFQSETRPNHDQPDAYTWCKAPRLGGAVVEVGAIARQAVDGQPLIRELIATAGSNVHARVVARLIEIARIVIAMEGWVGAIEPGSVFSHHGNMPRDATGIGLTEAARGSLGHWLRVEKGRIANYQIIAPTTWNFSPRDAGGTPGALEQALVGAPVHPGEAEPVAVQHIVRSFDPCLVCTVH
ncbi:MAG: nickel-dependent hydrogenase large subunit [Alphaproteobacteria bacterium]